MRSEEGRVKQTWAGAREKRAGAERTAVASREFPTRLERPEGHARAARGEILLAQAVFFSRLRTSRPLTNWLQVMPKVFPAGGEQIDGTVVSEQDPNLAGTAERKGKRDEPWYSPTSLSDVDTPRAPEEPMTYDAP